MTHAIVLAALVAAALVTACPALAAGGKIDPDVPDRGIFSLRPAPRWEEALLIGNGKMGGLVMGTPFNETITLTHERLFLPIVADEPTVETASHLDEIRDLLRVGKYAEAAGLVMKLDRDQGRPGRMVWTNPFFPACDLRITLDGDANAAPTDYRRSLDYATGVARVQYTRANTLYQQRALISRCDNVAAIELTATGNKRLSGKVAVVPHPLPPDADKDDRRVAEQAPENPAVTADGEWIMYRAAYRKGAGGYEVLARVVATGGKAEAADGVARFDGASKVLILLRIAPLATFAESEAERTRKDIQAVGVDFDAIGKRHATVHGEIYGRQKLDLGGAKARHVPAEELWQQTHEKTATPALLEQVFDAGRYEILCSCGDSPPNLQGVWAGAWHCPWRGDYTLNGNVPSAIGNLLNGHMPELMHSVFDYFEPRMEHFRSNAKRHYGARGIFIPSRTSTSGYNLTYSPIHCMTFWTAGAAWYAGFYYDYYLYTGDEKFLRETALPFMKEAALFYEDFLTKDANGVYEFNPSYSPENNPGNSRSQACINATMDLAACRQLLGNLIEACGEMEAEKKNVAKWKDMLAHLPKYMIGEEGELKEWITPKLKEKQKHRHCSHFLGLWYGIDPAIAESPKLLAAAKKAVGLRSEYRRKSGNVMGFGEVQIGLAAASLGEAELAWGAVERLATHYYYPTFASSHNTGPSIFNADISGGLPAVMVEMLVQSRPGFIRLLGALPQQMPTGCITGVPCRGQVTVHELKWSPKMIEFTLVPAKDLTKIDVDYNLDGRNWKTRVFDLKANQPRTTRFKAPD